MARGWPTPWMWGGFDYRTRGLRFAADYYDGIVARSQPAAIAVTDVGIVIFAAHGAMLGHWPAERVILAEPPRDGEPVRIALDGTTARLVIGDPGVVEALERVTPRLYRRVRLSWGGLARIAGWAGAAVGSVAFILLVVVPSLSEQLAAVTPHAVRLRIGSMTLRQLTRLVELDKSGPPRHRRAYCSDAEGRNALEAMAVRVTANMPEPPSLRLVVINTRLANAFALPGGIVVLTKGLIDDALSPEEVAGVIAHEIGHIHYDHPIQGLYRTAAVSVVVGLVTGDVAGGILITGLGRWVLNSGYSRMAERRADDYALERLYAAGIDSKGFEEFFTRALAKQAKGEGALSGFLSTHPLTRERIETVRRAPRATGKVFGGDHREWRRLGLICWATRAAPPPIRVR